MTGSRYRILLVILTLVIILMAVISESVYFSDFEYRFRTRMFNRILHDKESIMEECLLAMKPFMADGGDNEAPDNYDLFSLAEQNDITLLEYLDNKLVHWSGNGFDVPVIYHDSLFSEPLVFLQNAWFLTVSFEAGDERIVGLLRLRSDYSIENDIIRSGFEKAYRIPGNVGFSTDEDLSDFHIVNRSGDFLFSLIFPAEKEKSCFIYLPLSLWCAVLFMIVLLLLELLNLLLKRGRRKLAFVLLPIAFSLLYSFILFSGKPAIIYQAELFLPYRFSLNSIIPSTGHLLLFALFIIVITGFYFKKAELSGGKEGRELKDQLLLPVLLMTGALLFGFSQLVFNALISTSNINFETYKVLELDLFSLAGYLSVILLFFVPVLFLIKLFQLYKYSNIWTILYSSVPSFVIFMALSNMKSSVMIPMILFYLSMVVVIWTIIKKKTGSFNLSVLLSLVFATCSLYFITLLSKERTTENLKIQAVSFSTENDPEAEHLLLDMWPDISGDVTLEGLMGSTSFNTSSEEVERISDYLRETYFNGYLGNFNFNVVLCRSDDPLFVGPENYLVDNCFTFFEERIMMHGHQLTGTEFYFIDNQGGRPYYLGRLFYEGMEGYVNGLFIELYSDVNVFQPGYSELLLDKKYHQYEGLKDYSFAKYINGEIVLVTGEFSYDNTDVEYIDKTTDYRIFTEGGFRHVLYKNGNTTVIISGPGLTPGDIIISFAYLFAFIFLFSNLFILIFTKPALKKLNVLNFRQKLQLSFVGILLFSFLLIGIVIASLTINQYQTKHNETIKEKLNSIYIELYNNLAQEDYISGEWSNNEFYSLNEFLIRLSNIFNTDINLYDLNGYLMATSRPEIFYRNLTSRRINMLAFMYLNDLKRPEYLHNERIGNLEYLSAYVPFLNADNETIAYLNLPYFRMQSVLAREISNLIVAVINLTLLLIVVTMSMAVFISGRLTSPLLMLSKGLASVEVGKKSEHLKYKGNDEITELVKQYNRMVDEIEESTGKLANSEREYAWREMARQIAHEIKNPLTPMKLNVQQLFKSWRDKAPEFEKKLERFTENQIEYIDNLSSIASAFSSFAKMPASSPAEINLLDQIKITLDLFKDTDNITFWVKWPHESQVIVYADKEHMAGVFSNLIKNGIQSIPQGREGLIKVIMEVMSDKVTVSVSDNGTGIPEDLKNKLFTPNFTTKSSGMGLGLSIVKKYIEIANGKIWFESAADKGTTFFIELPLMYTVEKLG